MINFDLMLIDKNNNCDKIGKGNMLSGLCKTNLFHEIALTHCYTYELYSQSYLQNSVCHSRLCHLIDLISNNLNIRLF